MSFGDTDKKSIQDRSLRKAIRFYENITNLAKSLKTHHSSITKVLNESRKLSLKHALKIERETRIDLECLSPFTEEENKLIKSRDRWLQNPFIEIEVQKILIHPTLEVYDTDPERPIIINTDGILISGLLQLEQHKAKYCKKISVIVVDLEGLWLEIKTLEDFNFKFVDSERFKMGRWYEKEIGNCSGFRSDLISQSLTENLENTAQPLPARGEVIGRKDIKIARILGYSTNNYYRLKQVYLYKDRSLMQAVDLKQTTIGEAAELVEDSKPKKHPRIQSNLEGVTKP